MNKNWSDEGWDDYEYWQKQDRRTVAKINKLLKDIERNGVSKGEGKPEFLKYIKSWK
jgi:toxin YoeB